jgi:hypothetical protein
VGFAASQARLLLLTAYVSDLELQGQFINSARLQLANSVGELFSISADVTPGTPLYRQVQAAIAAIQALDKGLELQLRRIDSQRRAAQTELEAVQKVLQKNIENTFKTFG